MGVGLKLVGVVLVCIVLTACGKSVEEKTVVEAVNNKDVNPSRQSAPKCEKRDSKGFYIVPGGCTKAEFRAWKERGSPNEM